MEPDQHQGEGYFKYTKYTMIYNVYTIHNT